VTLDLLDPTWGPVSDKALWATQIIGEKARKGHKLPKDVDLADAIVDIDTTDTIRGSSTIVLTIADLTGALLDNGFFDVNADGKPEPLDVNYPDGSRYWWRLTQIGLDYSGQGVTGTLTFMARGVVLLDEKTGHRKASRGKRTRAQFLRDRVAEVKQFGGLKFVCREVSVKQPIEGTKTPKKSAAEKRDEKASGITPNDRLRIKHVKPNSKQLRRVELALQEAQDADAPEKAALELLMAGIGEDDFGNTVNSLGYGGSFQGAVRVKNNPNPFADMDDDTRTSEEAKSFLKGGRGFQGGGAIALANAHPDWPDGKIATTVEGSGEAPHFYGQWRREAELLLEAYGGAGSLGGTTYTKQFNFEIGSAANPHEKWWDGMTRLANDVEWPLFEDGSTIYFDDEMTLIRQRPVAVLHRDDPAVVSCKGNVDAREIATECELVLICDPFEFRAGEVFQLDGFGPLSSGSTAKPKPLPGRWLIEDAERKPHELATTFTLKQPVMPKKEPRGEQGTRSDPSDAGADLANAGKTPKEIIDNVVIPIATQLGVAQTPLGVRTANAGHTHLGSASDHAGPPDQKWADDIGIGPDIRGGGNKAGAELGDKIAKALADKFGLKKWHGEIVNGYFNSGGRRFRVQLIWRYEDAQAGNHYTHVHVGIKRVSKFDGAPTEPSASPYSTPTSGPTPLPPG
jgi:hypothetical protein